MEMIRVTRKIDNRFEKSMTQHFNVLPGNASMSDKATFHNFSRD